MIRNGFFRFSLLLVFYTLYTAALAQTWPVQATLTLVPPYSVRLSDYAHAASDKLMLHLFLKDLSTEETSVKLRFTLTGPGMMVATRTDFSGPPVSLYGGMATVLEGADLAEYFLPENLDFSGLSASAFARTGRLPEGAWRFSVEAVDYYRETTVSNAAGALGWFVLNDPPTVLFPARDEKLKAQDPQNVFFQWAPGHAGSPNAAFSTEYLFQVIELWPADQSPNDAFLTSPVFYETATLQTSLIYGPEAPSLVPGNAYAVRVQARTQEGEEGLDLFWNDGYSEVVRFVYDDPCKYPDNIGLSGVSHDMATLEWQADHNHTEFRVSWGVKDQEESDYMVANVLTEQSRLNGLSPNVVYEYRVSALCGPFESDYSPAQSFKTTDMPAVMLSCGKPPGNFDLSTGALLPELQPGGSFYAGDFMVQVEEVTGAGSPPFSGTGSISPTFFKQARALVSFHDISINSSRRLVSGEVVVEGGELVVPEQLEKALDSLNKLLEMADEVLAVAEVVYDTISAMAGSGKEEENINEGTTPGEGETPSASDTLAIDGEVPEGEYAALTDAPVGDNQVEQSSGTTTEDNGGPEETSGTEETIGGETVAVDPETGTSVDTGVADAETNPVGPSGLPSSFQLGPLDISLTGGGGSEEKDEEGNCVYKDLSCKVGLVVESQYYSYTLPLEVEGLTLVMDCEDNAIVGASFSWTGAIKSPAMGWLETTVTGLEITATASGEVSGTAAFRPDLVVPERLSEVVRITGLPEGEIVYRFGGGQGSVGSFDFSGLHGLDFLLDKGNAVLYETAGATFNRDGELLIEISGAGPYQWDGVTVKSLDLLASLSVWEGLRLHEGAVGLELEDVPGAPAPIGASVSIENGLITGKVLADDLRLFGMALTNTDLTVEMDRELDFIRTTGSFDVSHPDFSDKLKVAWFEYADGTLQSFSASGSISYDGLDIIVQETAYDASVGVLSLDALATITQGENTVSAQLTGFGIKEDGTVIPGDYTIDADLNQQFGPLRVVFATQPASTGEKEDRYEIYRDAEAALFLKMKEGEKVREKEIAKALISFKKRRNGDWRDFAATWTGSGISVGKVKSLETFITSFNISVADMENPAVVGTVDARTRLLEDARMSELDKGFVSGTGFDVVVKKGAEGTARFVFDASTEGFNGAWELRSLKNLDVHLYKNQQAICKLDNAQYHEDGKVSGTLSALPSAEFAAAWGKVKVKQMQVGASFYPFRADKGFTLLRGKGQFELTGLKGVRGTVVLNSSFDEENILSSVDLNTKLTAFGMALSDFDLSAALDRSFELQTLEGSLKAKHDLFSAKLDIARFEYTPAGLQTFEARNAAVAYRGFDFELNELVYRNSSLDVSAKVALGLGGTGMRLAVDHFLVDSLGAISVGKIAGRLDKTPVMMQFEATFSENRFQGEFDGEFGSYFSLSGNIDVGSKGDYNFGYLALRSSANIPVAPGVMISSLSGNLGYNYALTWNADRKKFTGAPAKGNYVVGLGLGLADQAGLMELYGNPIVQFGKEKTELSLIGELSVPRKDPNFKGNLTVSYNLTDNIAAGRLSSDIVVPAKTGKIIDGRDLGFDFRYSGKGWEVQGQGLRATVLSKLEFTGGISLSGPSDGAMTGSLSGNIDFDYHYNFKGEYSVGSIEASLDLGLHATALLVIREDDLEGRVAAGVNGSLSLKVTSGLLGTLYVSSTFDGSASVERKDNRNLLSADIDFQVEALKTTWEYSEEIAVEL